MCTVTFVPQSTNSFVLTSNRDEAPSRKTLAPQLYTINDVDVIFPKDEMAGGTWIGVSGQHRMACLLNGGYTAHQRKEKYRMSRGIIVTNLLTTKDFVLEIDRFDFNDIEPFTLLLVDWSERLKLYELVWDGETTHFSEKPLVPTIWSSSLLYSEGVKNKRRKWFTQFLNEGNIPSASQLLNFHKNAGEGDIKTNVIMDKGFVKTKSITQIVTGKKNVLRYEDLQKDEVVTLSF